MSNLGLGGQKSGLGVLIWGLNGRPGRGWGARNDIHDFATVSYRTSALWAGAMMLRNHSFRRF